MQGIRKGSEINRLERKAIGNRFLSEAMEGYDKFRKGGGHEIRIKRMQSGVSAQTRPSNYSTVHHWGIVAGIPLIVAIAIAGYFLWNRDEPEVVLVDKTISEPLDATPAEIPDENAVANIPVKQETETNRVVETDNPQEPTIAEEIKNVPVADNPPGQNPPQPTPVDSTAKKEVAAANANKEEKKPAIAEPTIGHRAYSEYLRNNLVRPEDEECKTATGSVTLSFSIDKNGHPYNIRVIKSLCPLADGEAIRLVKNGPPWTIGESFATVSVHF
jgi:hypothetical protein